MLHRIDDIARRQHGVISTRQLAGLGCSSAAISRMTARGTLVSAGRGAYRTIGTPPTWRQDVMAAIISNGPETLASHRTAAALHFPNVHGHTIDVTSARHQRSYRRGIHAHESLELRAADRWVIDGIPTTAIDRTLIDVGRYWPERRVGQFLDLAVRDGLTTYEQFAERVEVLARQGRNGIGTARLVLADRGFGDGWGFEKAMMGALRDANLPRPQREHLLAIGGQRFYLDFAYVDELLAIECDSTMWHTTPHQFESDLERQNVILGAGWLLLRYTPRRLRDDSVAIMKEVARHLDARSTRSG